jgi:predicted RNase H-like HicB family nuclease
MVTSAEVIRIRSGCMHYDAYVHREGKHLLVDFPDCPGCQTFADGPDALAAAAQEALEGWLEANLVARFRRGRYLAPELPRRRDSLGSRCAQVSRRHSRSAGPGRTQDSPRRRLPLGVQFAAAHGHDRMLLDLALALEAAQPWEAIAPRERWLAASASS